MSQKVLDSVLRLSHTQDMSNDTARIPAKAYIAYRDYKRICELLEITPNAFPTWWDREKEWYL